MIGLSEVLHRWCLGRRWLVPTLLGITTLCWYAVFLPLTVGLTSSTERVYRVLSHLNWL